MFLLVVAVPVCNVPCLYPIVIDGQRLACGRCVGCRIKHSQDWQIRLTYELKSWNYKALFVTLTYSDENLPMSETGLPTLDKKALQLYIKRIRKELSYDNRSIKYFAVGEYGGSGKTTRFGKVIPCGRSHYHLILFGVDANDVPMLKKHWHGDAYPRWDFGHAWGFVEADSIAYVTGYCLKKWTGAKARSEYVDRGIAPPFQLSSQGLGLEGFMEDIDRIDKDKAIVFRGKPRGVPRYFRKKADWKVDWNEQKIAEMEAVTNEQLKERFETMRQLGYRKGLDRKTNLLYQHTVEDFVQNHAYEYEKAIKFRGSSKENKIL